MRNTIVRLDAPNYRNVVLSSQNVRTYKGCREKQDQQNKIKIKQEQNEQNKSKNKIKLEQNEIFGLPVYCSAREK
jgi:hypothetical protein